MPGFGLLTEDFKMRIGCCTSLDDMGKVQSAGFDYIELPVFAVKAESPDSEFEPVRDLTNEFDIAPEAWNCLLSPDMKIVGPEVDLYRIERYLRTAFERISEIGGEIAVFGSGAARRIPDDFSTDEAKDQLMEFLALAGRIAGSQGITIAVEPLNSSETNVINTVTEGLALIRSVDHPFVKLTVDLHHMMMENEPLEHILEAGPEIVHVHVADTNRRHPGSGKYPTARFIELIKQTGYDERISTECGWTDLSRESPDAIALLRSLAQPNGSARQ